MTATTYYNTLASCNLGTLPLIDDLLGQKLVAVRTDVKRTRSVCTADVLHTASVASGYVSALCLKTPRPNERCLQH